MTAKYYKREILKLRKKGNGYKGIARVLRLKRDQVRGFLLDQVEWRRLTEREKERIFSLKKSGKGYKKIARIMGVNRSRVYYLLSSKNRKKKTKGTR